MILHLAFATDWDNAGEHYRISTRGRTLEQEGFIHCSYDTAQLDGVAALFYADVTQPLVVLEIDPTGLDVREEGGFPHLYGPIPATAVTEVRPYEHNTR